MLHTVTYKISLQQVVEAQRRRVTTLKIQAKTWYTEMGEHEPEYNNSGQDIKERVVTNLKVFARYLSTMDCEERTTWVSSVSVAWKDCPSRLPHISPTHFFFYPPLQPVKQMFDHRLTPDCQSLSVHIWMVNKSDQA